MLKKLKIALLIIILVEEIRSARKRTVRINVGIDEEQLAKIVNKENAKNAELFLF